MIPGRRGLRRWAKPLRFSHIFIVLFFNEKAVVFQTIYRLFLFKYSIFFFKGHYFLKGKPPFIFDSARFISDQASILSDSITKVLDPEKLAVLARKSGFQRRESKLRPEEFIDTLMFCGFD